MSRQREPLRIMVSAGGTGGHIFPGLAVAAEAMRRGHDVMWVGTATGMESSLVPAEAIRFAAVHARAVRGRNVLGRFTALLAVVRSTLEAVMLIRKNQPHLVLGFGGYVCAPVGLAAWLCRCPLVIHEQNAVAGLTNRVLAKIATLVFQAFPGTLSARQVWTVGNPVRESIRTLPAKDYASAGRRPFRILVLGGSLGAQAINRLVPAALAQAGEVSFEIRHQCGKDREAEVNALYDTAGRTAVVSGFIDDMAAALAWADFAICRAGALTVSEMASAGVPAIFIPYPHAVDDHQTRNAAVLVACGGALSLPESQLDAGKLASAMMQLACPETLTQMHARLRALWPGQNASIAILDHCEEVVYG